MIMSMDVLPDCPCGGPCVLVIDETGGWEQCTKCGRELRPAAAFPEEFWIRRCAEVREQARRGEL